MMVSQERIHSRCGIFLQGGDDMTVCVHREAYLWVSVDAGWI